MAKAPLKLSRLKSASKMEAVPSGAPSVGQYHLSDGITQGLLSDFLACRERARLYLSGVRPRGTTRYLAFGSLFHKCLELYYGEGVDVEHESNRYFEEQISNGRNPQEVEEDVAILPHLFAGYAKHWMKEDEEKEWVELEGVFDTPLDIGGETMRLRGRCDGIFRVNGRLWLFETKTMSQMQEGLNDALALDNQVLMYITAKSILLGEEIIGVCYNVIRRPGQRASTPQELADKVEKDIRARPNHYYIRYPMTYPPKVREEFLRGLKLKLREFSGWLRGGVAHYRNECACRQKFLCKYLGCCISGGSLVGYDTDGKLFPELEDE